MNLEFGACKFKPQHTNITPIQAQPSKNPTKLKAIQVMNYATNLNIQI